MGLISTRIKIWGILGPGFQLVCSSLVVDICVCANSNKAMMEMSTNSRQSKQLQQKRLE